MTDTATLPIPRKLNESTIAAFQEGIIAGLPIERVCHHLGIGERTYYNWRDLGIAELEAEDPEIPEEQRAATRSLYGRLWQGCQDARLRAERRAVLALVNAAVGDEQIVERTTTSRRWVRDRYDEANKVWTYRELVDETKTIERRTVRDWRAALAWLERTQPETYARVTRQWISGPTGDGPVEISVEEMRSKIDQELDELAEKLGALPLADGPPVG